MTEENEQSLAAKELDNWPKQHKEPEKHKGESHEHCKHGYLEPQTVSSLSEKKRDNTQQREAIIRPQQAGKIDFKSLQNHSFSSRRMWLSGKDSPQSPSGKNRNRDKNKKTGKERGNPHQLYRLSITNPRSNPTIGIAYPQQKVSPPKKLESSRVPVSGSYRFHVPSIPEREAELEQEDLQYRCFQEVPANGNPHSYTPQTVGELPRQVLSSLPQQTQQKTSLGNDSSSAHSVNENAFSEFQPSETDVWQPSDRTFRNVSFAVPSQKSNLLDLSKMNGGFIPFHYGYPLLDTPSPDSYSSKQSSQDHDFIDISLAPSQAPSGSFSFQTSVEGHDLIQTSEQFHNDLADETQSYQLHPKPPQYLQTSHGVAITDPTNGPIPASSPHQSEHSKSVADKSDSFSPIDSRASSRAVGAKRMCNLKNVHMNQSALVQGSVHNIMSNPDGSQSHVFGHNCIPISPGSSDKSGSKQHKVSNPWDAPIKAFPSSQMLDQTSAPLNFQYQPSAEQRQSANNNGRMTRHQVHVTAPLPNQNKTDHSRQICNPHRTLLIGSPDWQNDSKSHRNVPKKANEVFSNSRQDSVKHECNTAPPNHFASQGYLSQSQVGDLKNKSINFGINPSVPVATSRTCSYSPLHVAPMGLRLVSQYDSPSHSPTCTSASNSTYSSLSPASTNSANSGSEDRQIPKILPPQFYHHNDKALISNILTNDKHHYLSEAYRGLPNKQDATKENVLGFAPNNRAAKAISENGKFCLDMYRSEQPPPPSYSTHQLLATANLDQLDVLLTCKQCDQNFTNLASFLDHKQYCGHQSFAQNELKEVSKVEDMRKLQTDNAKAMPGSSYAILCSSSDLHLSLLELNKNGDLVPDHESKGEIKDDALKLMLPSGSLPELEMEDPKLDSLITEALNGLGYQSDNAEIDSSFIDAFVDDDLTASKSTTRQTLTPKSSTVFEGRTSKESSIERPQGQIKYTFDSDSLSAACKQTDLPLKESQHELLQKDGLKVQTCSSLSQSQECKSSSTWEARKYKKAKHESEYGSKYLLASKISSRCGLKSLQSRTALVKTCRGSSSARKCPIAQKPVTTEAKRKKTGSWSKELIHKIVHQKNKLHKLHVKGTKNMQFSLVMERVTPAVPNQTFREYDYVSDSDDDCEPVKISQGRLSQSIRCKYTYTKECKERSNTDKPLESFWKQNQNERYDTFDLNSSPTLIMENHAHQRIRRRSSRSSTSSDLSTSLSICSDSISSPKSFDQVDSDVEKDGEVQAKDQQSLEQTVYETSPRIRKESSTSLALTFTKNTKRYSTDKILLSEQKDSFTTAECSSIVCKTGETASEHTLTKSTLSLARFKTTRVEIEEKGDHYSFEAGILQTSDKSDHSRTITSPRGSAIKLKPLEGSHKTRKHSLEFQASIFGKPNSDNSFSEESMCSNNTLLETPGLCSSNFSEKDCLSPSKMCDASTQKNTPCLIPYPPEQDQSFIKSPISFDTSSMFGDLSVGGFESNLYPDIQLAKDGFNPLETQTDKKELFESSFSPYLEQKDWDILVPPVLLHDISHYKEDLNGSKTDFNHVPFALPEKLIDYNPTNTASATTDDLEIKRIVTELESQLQTAKLSSPTPLENQSSLQTKPLTMSKLSPLRLDTESDHDSSNLEMDCGPKTLLSITPGDSHPGLFLETEAPWSSPLTYGVMCGQQGLHTPTHSATNTDSGQGHPYLKDSMGLVDLTRESDSPLHQEDKEETKSEEMLEHEIYTENLMKSLEVISDSLSSGFTSPQSSPQQELREQEYSKSENEPKLTFNNKETEFLVETHNFADSSSASDNSSPNKETQVETCFDEAGTLEDERITVSNQQIPKSIFAQRKHCGISNEIKSHDCESTEESKVNESQAYNESSTPIAFANVDATSKSEGSAYSDTLPSFSKSKSTLNEDILMIISQHFENGESNTKREISRDEVVQDGRECTDSASSMPDRTQLPAPKQCEENLVNNEQVAQLQPAIQPQKICQSPQKDSEQRDSSSSVCFSDDYTKVPSLGKRRLGSEQKNVTERFEENVIHFESSVIANNSPTRLNNSFIASYDVVITEGKTSNSGAPMNVDISSEQAEFGENFDHSLARNDSQDKNAFFNVHLGRLSSNKRCFSNYTSKCLHNEIDKVDIKPDAIESLTSIGCSLHSTAERATKPTEANLQPHPRNFTKNHAKEISLMDSDQILPLPKQNTSKIPIETASCRDPQIKHLKKLDDKVEGIMTEHDVLLEKSAILDIKETLNHVIPCAKALLKTAKCSPLEKETEFQKPSPTKAEIQISLPEKFQCEICAMFFRTQPGLKRHKAIKHVAKIPSAKNVCPLVHTLLETPMRDNMSVIDQKVQINLNRKEIHGRQEDSADPCFPMFGPEMSVGGPERSLMNQLSSVNETTNANSKTSLDQMCSEVLSSKQFNKTDIISDETHTPSQEMNSQCSSQNHTDVNIRETNLEPKDAKPEEVTHKRQFNSFNESETSNDPTDNMQRNYNVKAKDDYSLEDSSMEIKCENTRSCVEDKPTVFKDGSDVTSFFDDDSTFSQLFPRNTDKKRKKCTRVYGKSNKKAKLTDLDTFSTTLFVDKSEESNEKIGAIISNDEMEFAQYETGSIDRDKTLDADSKSFVKSSTENVYCFDTHSAYCEKDVEEDKDENKDESLSEHQMDSQGTMPEITAVFPSEEDFKQEHSTPSSSQLLSVHETSDSQIINTTDFNTTIQPLEPEQDVLSINANLKDQTRPCRMSSEPKSRKPVAPGLKQNKKQYKCKVCFIWFLTLGELDFHKISHNPSPPPTCYMCVQRKFSFREQLRDHLREKHAKNKAGIWTCGMCLKEISDVWMYNEHLREHATQFARKGQSQSSLLSDMPGCLMQENAVKNFISTIMQHQPQRPAKKATAKPPSEDGRRDSSDVPAEELNSADNFDSTNLRSKLNVGRGAKHCSLTSLEVLPKAESSSKNAEMHPNCKNPSRDCHHCGKQFPKPFKLQRHLVVHSLQKIFLCQKCPVSYQDAEELKDHLKKEHQDTQEPESKHTTLYTCELCADVMHVIKKSFICSTCNYTFSKKEQFDRHMEKHLAEGSKIFKFRGVVRPCKPFNFNNETDSPSSKRKANCDTDVELSRSTDADTNSMLPKLYDGVPYSSEERSTETNRASVKIEDEAVEFPNPDHNTKQSQVQVDSTISCFPKELKMERKSSSLAHDSHPSKSTTVNLADKAAETELGDVKTEYDCSTSPLTSLVAENDALEQTTKHRIESVEDNTPIDLENKSERCEIRSRDAQIVSQLKDISTLEDTQRDSTCVTVCSTSRENEQTRQCAIRNTELGLKTLQSEGTSLVKLHVDGSEETFKASLENSPKILTPESMLSCQTHSKDVDLTKQQRKRKDFRTFDNPQKTSFPTTRENLGIESRVKKKAKAGSCENIDEQRKMEICPNYPVLKSVKEDTASNKIIPKSKLGSSNLQQKKCSLDFFPPKQVEIGRHFNGDCKRRKHMPGKITSPHSTRVSSINQSFNKSHAKQGVRSIDTHSFRTAESQNNLLSQLFGPRLTSFKIPLRKDPTESIN